MNPRLKNLYAKLKENNLDGLFVSLPANISYLTKYTSRDSYFIASPKGNIYITDSRYTEEAKVYLKGTASIKNINGSAFKAIADSMSSLGLKRVGFEERYLAFAEYQKILGYLDKDIMLIATHSLVEALRQLKDADEVKRIRQAALITVQALDFAKKFIKPGRTEIEVAAEIERFIRYKGARSSSFEIIVAGGPNAAYPHHITSDRKLRDKEMVLIDMGVDFSGYKSDLTRTFFLGKITPLARKIYDIVAEAQKRAISLIKPGINLSSLDFAARGFIAKNGYGACFGHNLGHGVGLEIHEAPSLSGKEEAKVKPGMVFTVEPGIYLPGKLGVRIEDMVLVTKERAEVLSGTVDQ